MPRLRHPNGLDVVDVPDALGDYYGRQGYTPALTAAEIQDLRGADLDQALTDNGLPTAGKADEKRARLADQNQEN